jgi:acyl dehydratase
MGAMMDIKLGQDIPPLVKEIAQERINLFELSGGKHGPSFFTDAATAKKTIGLDSPMASGRMSVSFALECLRRFFGDEVFNRSGTVDLRNLRPVRAGDAITIRGKVSEIRREANGQRVLVEVSITNQKGDTTSAGTGSAIVPSGLLPVE